MTQFFKLFKTGFGIKPESHEVQLLFSLLPPNSHEAHAP